ncbi:MAG: HEAT repeat domain-containing protein, partial [Acidobacteria bacterium]|nr:HEAT repeat domain-containing protein [Acidobacteriota bacterium]
REALAAFGETAIPALRLFMNDPEEPLWVRRAIPKTISLIESPLAAEALVDSLDGPSDMFLRRKLLEALDSLGVAHEEPARRQKIRREIGVEAKRYLIALADLHALNRAAAVGVDHFSGPQPVFAGGALLEQLLAERGADHRTNLFGLLALIYDRGPIWDAFRSLQNPSLRAHALEFLDCSLEGEDKNVVLAAVGDAPLADKLSRAERQFGIARASKIATVLKHLSPRDERTEDAPYLAVGAMHTVFTESITDLYPAVHSLRATATDPFVLETAAWVAQRTGGPPERQDNDARL